MKNTHKIYILYFGYLCCFPFIVKGQYQMTGPLANRFGVTTTTGANNVRAISVGAFSPTNPPQSAFHINTNLLAPSPVFTSGEVFRTNGPSTETNAWRMMTGSGNGTETFSLYTLSNSNNVTIQSSQGDMSFNVGGINERIRILGNNGFVGVGTSTPTAKFQVTDGAVLAEGATGSTPVSGPGTRMMWIPDKAAFRAGWLTVPTTTLWDAANIGFGSMSLGVNTSASGFSGVSLGRNAHASGTFSMALGTSIGSFATHSFTIGVGPLNGSQTPAFSNNTPNSLMVVFNSNLPVLTVRGGNFPASPGNIGINTINPANRLEITHGSTGESGLTFTNLTNANTLPVPNPDPEKGVLSIDNTGRVILVTDETGSGGGGTVTGAQNGLTAVTSNTILELGGALLHPTDVALNSHTMTFSGIGNVGIGNNASSPQSRLHINEGNLPTYLQITNNNTNAVSTTPLATDGFKIGIAANGVAELRQQEAQSMRFFTNNTHRILLTDGGAGNNAGQVAIGNNLPLNFNPQDRLHLRQNAGETFVRFTNNTTGHGTNDGFRVGNVTNGDAEIRQKEANTLNFFTSDIQRATILANGNVGVNTATPTQQLDVDGQVRVRTLPQANTLNNVVVADAQGNLRVRDASTIGGGGSGTGDVSACSTLDPFTDNNYLTKWTNAGGKEICRTLSVYENNNGKVGVGITNPLAKLDVKAANNTNLDFGLRVSNLSGEVFSVENDGQVRVFGGSGLTALEVNAFNVPTIGLLVNAGGAINGIRSQNAHIAVRGIPNPGGIGVYGFVPSGINATGVSGSAQDMGFGVKATGLTTVALRAEDENTPLMNNSIANLVEFHRINTSARNTISTVDLKGSILDIYDNTQFATGNLLTIRKKRAGGQDTVMVVKSAGNGGGNVGIGIHNPSEKLEVIGKVKANGTVLTSDKRIKTNIDSIASALNIVKALKGVYYDYDTLAYDSVIFPEKYFSGKANGTLDSTFFDHSFLLGRQIGLLAQDVEPILPEVVNIDNKGVYSLDYSRMVAVLIEAIKEQQIQIDSLKNELQNGSVSAQQQAIDSLQNAQLTAIQACLDKLPPGLSCNKSQRLANEESIEATETLGKTSVTEVALSSTTIVLDQNNPNPFKESTVINYFIPEYIHFAQILFTDQLGRIINTVDINHSGNGQLNVKAEKLNNGIYTYSIVVDGAVIETKRMAKQ